MKLKNSTRKTPVWARFALAGSKSPAAVCDRERARGWNCVVNFCQLVHQCVRDEHGRLGALLLFPYSWTKLQLCGSSGRELSGCGFSQCFVMFSLYSSRRSALSVTQCIHVPRTYDVGDRFFFGSNPEKLRQGSWSLGVVYDRVLKMETSVISEGRISVAVQFSGKRAEIALHTEHGTKCTNHCHVVGKINVNMCNIKIAMDSCSLTSGCSAWKYRNIIFSQQ